MLNLDTHIVVALLDGELNAVERNLVVNEPLAISDIVLWELAKLVELGRLEFDLDHTEFRAFLRNSTILPITLGIARKSMQLDFKSDPADEIIAATSIVENIPLLTRDRRIHKSKLVPFP
jgi:PIN domain nuclease of toxin-antitoxin system